MNAAAIQNPSLAALMSRATASSRPVAAPAKVTAIDTFAKARSAAPTITLPPPAAPAIKMTAQLKAGADSFAANLRTAMNISDMSADNLATAFLKLNLVDPNNNVETHNALYEAASNLRQQAIDDAKVQSERAQALQKEAEKYATQAALIGTVVAGVSIATAVVTIGAGLALCVAAAGSTTAAAAGASAGAQVAASSATQAATTAAEQTASKSVLAVVRDAIVTRIEAACATVSDHVSAGAVRAVATITPAVGQGVSAASNGKLRQTEITAEDAKLKVDVRKQDAAAAQARVEEEGEIINVIIESKNAVVDAVTRMNESSWQSREKLISAAMAH